MSGITNAANSALQAFSTSQQVTANNIANMNTDGFKSSRTVFQEVSPSGVIASAAKTEDAVDISREATALISNTQGFKANLKTLQASDEMIRDLFSIKA
jgi:flagellar basal-body rod protein FlgC